MALTLALVATLSARALADDDDDGGSLDPAAGLQTQQPQAASEPQQLAVAAPGSTDGNDRAITGGSPPQAHPGEQPEPPVIVQGQAQAEHPGEQPTVSEDQSDQATQDEQGSGPVGCIDSCPPAPTDPVGPIAAAVGGGGFFDRIRRLLGWRSQQPPQPPQEPAPPPQEAAQQPGPPPSQLPSVADVEENLRAVEEVQAQRAQEGRRMSPREYVDEQLRLSQALMDMDELQAQVDLDPSQLADLRRRYDEAYARYYAGWQDTDHDVYWAYESLRRVEMDLRELSDRASGLPPNPGATYGPPRPQFWLDEARRSLDAARPAVEAERDPRDLDQLAELERHYRDLQQRLDRFNPMVSVDLGEAQLPGSSPVKRGQVPEQLPGTSAADLRTNVPAIKATTNLKTTVPPSRATDLPPPSELYRMTLIERLVDTLGLDPRIVAVATTAGGMAAIAESLPALALRFGLKVCVVCGLMQNNLPTDRPGAPPRSTPG
jgi:hypothetical protein